MNTIFDIFCILRLLKVGHGIFYFLNPIIQFQIAIQTTSGHISIFYGIGKSVNYLIGIFFCGHNLQDYALERGHFIVYQFIVVITQRIP